MKIPTCTLPDVSPSVQVKNDEDILPLHLKAQTKSYKMSSLGYAFLTWRQGCLCLSWSGPGKDGLLLVFLSCAIMYGDISGSVPGVWIIRDLSASVGRLLSDSILITGRLPLPGGAP